jgi:hypothetical protein
VKIWRRDAGEIAADARPLLKIAFASEAKQKSPPRL